MGGFIPPVLLKAIAFMESGWAHADYSVPYGGVGPTLVSHDCGYGILQVTSGMQNISGVPNLDQAMIGGHYAFNIARGTRILAEKWNLAPDYRPQVGTRQPEVIENWYYALWGYNGFAFVNHPLNPSYSPGRPQFSCGAQNDGFGHDRTQYPYQELIFGCVARPPVRGGTQLWSPQQAALPNLADGSYGGPLNPNNWNACVFSLQCAPMDMPSPSHNRDTTALNVNRSQVIGSPSLSVSPSTIDVNTAQPAGGYRLTIANTGTGPLAWRITENQPWLSVSPSQGVALGPELGGTASTVQVNIDSSALAGGVQSGDIIVESVGSAGSPARVGVNLSVFGDGSLIRGSGPAIYYMSSGIKRHIPNGPTFEAYHLNWGAVASVDDARLNAIPTGRPLLDVLADGNLLRGAVRTSS